MAGRPQQVTEDEILDAVAATVSASGPVGLTIVAVADRVGVTAPAVRQRFGSKHDLLVAFAARAADTATVSFELAAATTANPLEAIARGLGASATFRDRTELAHHLALLQLDLTDPQLGQYAVAHQRKFIASIRHLVVAAQRAKKLVASTNPDEIADSIYTTYNGALVTWAVDGTGALEDWLTERIRRTLLMYRAR